MMKRTRPGADDNLLPTPPPAATGGAPAAASPAPPEGTPSVAPAQEGDTYALQVLNRVFDILDVLAAEPATIAAISASLGLHRSTVFRLLANLERRGFVRKDDLSGAYSLGMKLYDLGTKALEEQVPIHRLRPLLDALASETRYTAQIWMRSGHEATCVDQVESPRDFRIVGRIGRRIPLNVGAVGRVLLAFAPEGVRAQFLASPLPRPFPRTTTDPAVLQGELERIAAQGWALTPGETRIISWAVAAPIYSPLGGVEAAVVVQASEDDEESPTLEQVRGAVVAAAAQMSRILGYFA
jgi:IclR family transcriptional regulator, acetate operon repressor